MSNKFWTKVSDGLPVIPNSQPSMEILILGHAGGNDSEIIRGKYLRIPRHDRAQFIRIMGDRDIRPIAWAYIPEYENMVTAYRDKITETRKIKKQLQEEMNAKLKEMISKL